jgi:hypothetical protein
MYVEVVIKRGVCKTRKLAKLLHIFLIFSYILRSKVSKVCDTIGPIWLLNLQSWDMAFIIMSTIQLAKLGTLLDHYGFF